MGGNLSKKLTRQKRPQPENGVRSGNRVHQENRFIKDVEGAKSNYNAYSVGPEEAKTEEVEDAMIKHVMRQQLALDSKMFVLNQLLLGVQFFANYDVDIEKSKDRVRTEQNLKSEKIRHCNKSVMMTNELSEAIDQSVVFQMRHGPQKFVLRNLFNHKLYIVHDNVEITNEFNENMTYSSVNFQPFYRLEFDKEYKQKRSGFVRLRFCDHVHTSNPDVVEDVTSSERNDSTETSTSTTSQTTSSLLYGDENVRVIKEHGMYNGSQGSTSSEYDYTYIASFNEHRPLMTSSNYNFDGEGTGNNGRITDPAAASILPDECITVIKRRILVDNASLPSDNLEDKFQYMEQRGQYLNSKMFMNYFKRLFRDQISQNLEIGSEQLMNATWKGASIYCPVPTSQGTITSHCEIIPAIACPWPSEAIDWFQRKRVLAAAPGVPKTWLTEEMINRIFDLSCHAIPIGYVSKKSHTSRTVNRSLEWKIIFPDAERYLESRLTDCQRKVYILVKILYKTYIEPLNIPMTSKAGDTAMSKSMPDLTSTVSEEEGHVSHFNFITDEHLRAHLFMQCELNTIKWNEFNLGGNLMEFLRTFLQRVQTKNLPDFFLPKRNLFENVPENVITRLHENIFRILENPVMLVMRALKNIRFVRNFYPKINMKRLYRILTISEPLALINPSLYCENELKKKMDTDNDEDDEEPEKGLDLSYPVGSMAEYHQQAKADPEKRRFTKQLKFQEIMKLKRIASTTQRRESVESINTEIVVDDHMHKYRRKAIYEIFVRQFLAAGQKCLDFENHKFVTIYVRQARRLADLLKGDHFEIDAHELQESIRALEILQKDPKMARSKANVGQKPAQQKTSTPRKPEIWRPPEQEPDAPVIPRESVQARSPGAVGTRKSILKNVAAEPLALRSTHQISITADVHHSTNTITAKAKATPIYRAPHAAATLNGTTNSDYTKITAIELIDKTISHHHHVSRITSHLENQDTHVSIM